MLHSLSVGHESERSVSRIGMGITSRRGSVAWNYCCPAVASIRDSTCSNGAVETRKIAAEWVAEGYYQDQHQDAGGGQHSRHRELHPQARRTKERTKGDRQSPADDQHEPHDARNGGLRSEQSLLSRVP